MNSQYCTNCHRPIEKGNDFCSHCGQKKDIYKKELGQLFNQFFGSIFNWDSKVFLTPLKLLKPGFLTQEYFKGRRSRYTLPGKLLLFLLLGYFSIIMIHYSSNLNNLDIQDESKNAVAVEKFINKNKSKILVKMSPHNTDSLILSDSLTHAYFDSLHTFVTKKTNNSRINVSFNGDSLAISKHDLYTLTTKELLDKHKVEGFINRIFYRNLIENIKNPSAFLNTIMSRVPWGVLLSLPLLAIVLLILYIRKKRYYVEHVVFLIHCFSFIFLMSTLFLIFGLFTQINGWILGTPFILGAIYILFAMKNYYKDSNFKLLLKYILFLFLSLFVFVLAFSIIAFFSFFVF